MTVYIHVLTPNTGFKELKFAQAPLPLSLHIQFCHLTSEISKIFCISSHWNQCLRRQYNSVQVLPEFRAHWIFPDLLSLSYHMSSHLE